MGLPQCGHVPAVMPTLAAAGDAFRLLVGELVALFLRRFENLFRSHFIAIVRHVRPFLSSRYRQWTIPFFLFYYLIRKNDRIVLSF